MTLPPKLQTLIDDFATITNRNERAEFLIEIADRFPDSLVPKTVSVRPHDEEHHVRYCESDAYVWAEDNEDGTLKFYFDVLNPQGLSAMAMAVIMDETLSGQPLEQVAAINGDMVFKIFGQEVSMGKGQGLTGIVAAVRHEADKRLKP
ncbi:MAG: SufE family protein [Armatimonadetes bacterium]|nr:SufE family protein [Anaerolineae bacterium]